MSRQALTTTAPFTNLGYLITERCAEFVRCPEVNCFPIPKIYPSNKPRQFRSFSRPRGTCAHARTIATRRRGSDPRCRKRRWSAAIQIAKCLAAGSSLPAANDGPKLAKAKELGATSASITKRSRIKDEVRRLTGKQRRGRGDMNMWAAATWTIALRVLARGGRLVTCGADDRLLTRKSTLRFLFSAASFPFSALTWDTKLDSQRCSNSSPWPTQTRDRSHASSQRLRCRPPLPRSPASSSAKSFLLWIGGAPSIASQFPVSA